MVRHASFFGNKSCLFLPGRVARRCHSVSYDASSRLARQKNPSISSPLIQLDGLLAGFYHTLHFRFEVEPVEGLTPEDSPDTSDCLV